EQLKAAFATGKTKGYAWRYAQLAALKQLLVEKEADIKAALAEDLHRHPFEAVGLEIIGSLVEVEYMLANLKEWMKPDYTDVPLWLAPASSEIVCEPFGVCLILCPFNYPVTLTLGPLMGALAAGNCVLVKPSEMTSATEKLMMDLIPRYLDGECVKVVAGGVNITSALLQLRWDKIFFTGSPRVGKIVMKAAAEHLTPVSLELGGKSPTIIDESVGDLELAAQRVMWGKCANAGQTCIAPDYVFCHEKHYDKFLALCASKLQQFYGPDPQQAPDYGRIVSKEHVQRLQGMLKEVGQQAVVTGGTVDEADKYVAPTIL
ncbi:aldehyde dehydrogenase 3B1, partial [Ochromonadaceae sp. CCMP2298]